MNRVLLSLIVLAVGSAPALAQAVKDTPAAAATRKKLQTKISVDFKDTRLIDCTKELKEKIEDAGGGALSFRFDIGVSMNLTITYSAKDKTLAEVLDGMFQKNGLGYVVVSLEKDRDDGWIKLKQGKERGYPAGATPVVKAPDKEKTKPVIEKPGKEPPKEKPPVTEGDKLEETAAARLSLAQALIDAGKADKVKDRLQDIIKMYPTTKAAAEAKKLLEKLNKK